MADKSALEELVPLGSAIHKFLQKTGTYERIVNWFARRTPYPIVVAGASGTGKTSLLKALSGQPAFVRREDRTDEVREVAASLEKVYLKLIDTPGEVTHEAKRKEAFKEALKYDSVGIINVVSYGYHEGKAPLSAVLRGNQPSEGYLQQRRHVELDLLREWVDLLCGPGGTVSWIATVVTKADLWWSDSVDQPVMTYYDEGPYSNALGSARMQAHSTKSFSALSNMFYGQVRMSGYYTDLRRNEDHAALVGHILQKASEHG